MPVRRWLEADSREEFAHVNFCATSRLWTVQFV